MTINFNYEVPLNNVDFDNEEYSNDFNHITEVDLAVNANTKKNSKHTSKRNFLAKKKVTYLQQERIFSKFDDANYDDWD